MFNPLKQGAAIKKAMEIRKELSKIEAESEKGRVKVILNGDMKVKSVVINGEEMKDARDAFNEAIDKVQKRTAEKMQQMGAGLQELLGGLG